MRLEAVALLFILVSTCAFASETNEHSSGTAAAKEHLHHSLALPTSYADVKQPAAKAKEADKPTDAGKAVKDAPTTTAQLPQLPGTPCPYHKGMVHSELPSFGSMFGSILSEAAKDVFGVEQVISTHMHDIFEDLMSGPAIPHVLDMLEGAVSTAQATLPTLLPPFIRGFEPRFAPTFESVFDSRQPVLVSTVSRSQPVFGIVITSSSGRSADVSDESAQPSWEQEVIISSSNPSRLQQLADMFEKQLHGSSSSSSAGLGRRLKSVAGVRVQPADVAQVVLTAARKFRALKAL